MNVMRSKAQPELIHVLLTEQDAHALRAALRKEKSPHAKHFRSELKKVLK